MLRRDKPHSPPPARKAKAADAAGPMAGHSRANQTSKYTPDAPALVGRKVLRANSASRQVQGKEPGPLNPAHGMAADRGVGHMARGIGSRDAPHSAAALQDNRAAATKAERGVGPVGGGGKLAKPVTGKTAKVAAKKQAKVEGTDNRKVTLLKKDYAFGAPGTARRVCWDAMAKAKTVADYLAGGGKAKYLGRWQAAGVIKLG